MKQFVFEQLHVYQKAIEFSDQAYRLSQTFPNQERYGITDQFRRAAVSIALNIAEGGGQSSREFRHALRIARGSVHECIAILEISSRLGYLSSDQKILAYAACTELAKMITALMRSLQQEKTS